MYSLTQKGVSTIFYYILRVKSSLCITKHKLVIHPDEAIIKGVHKSLGCIPFCMERDLKIKKPNLMKISPFQLQELIMNKDDRSTNDLLSVGQWTSFCHSEDNHIHLQLMYYRAGHKNLWSNRRLHQSTKKGSSTIN